MKMFPKVIGGAAGMAAILVIGTLNAQAQNLLVNGSFEDAAGFTANPISLTSGPGGTSGVNLGWANFNALGAGNGAGQSSDVAESGTYSLLTQNAVGNNWNPAGTYQIVSGVAVGSTYTLGASYQATTALSGTYATPVAVQLTFLDSGLNNLGTVETGSGNNAGGFTFTASSLNTWLPASVSGTAPAGTAYAEVYLMFMDNAQTATDSIYFDNASLTLVPEPTSLALLVMGLGLPFYVSRRRK